MAINGAGTAGDFGYALLIAAGPGGKQGKRRVMDAAAALPQLAAVAPAVLVGTPGGASVVQLVDPADPQTVLAHLRTAATHPGPVLVYLAGQLTLDSKQQMPHLALAHTTARTARYSALPWHWLTAELGHRPPGSTTVVADLVADGTAWPRMAEQGPAVQAHLAAGLMLYGVIAPVPRRRRGLLEPRYSKAFATLLRGLAERPPLPLLHERAVLEAGLGGGPELLLGAPPRSAEPSGGGWPAGGTGTEWPAVPDAPPMTGPGAAPGYAAASMEQDPGVLPPGPPLGTFPDPAPGPVAGDGTGWPGSFPAPGSVPAGPYAPAGPHAPPPGWDHATPAPPFTPAPAARPGAPDRDPVPDERYERSVPASPAAPPAPAGSQGAPTPPPVSAAPPASATPVAGQAEVEQAAVERAAHGQGATGYPADGSATSAHHSSVPGTPHPASVPGAPGHPRAGRRADEQPPWEHSAPDETESPDLLPPPHPSDRLPHPVPIEDTRRPAPKTGAAAEAGTVPEEPPPGPETETPPGPGTATPPRPEGTPPGPGSDPPSGPAAELPAGPPANDPAADHRPTAVPATGHPAADGPRAGDALQQPPAGEAPARPRPGAAEDAERPSAPDDAPQRARSVTGDAREAGAAEPPGRTAPERAAAGEKPEPAQAEGDGEPAPADGTAEPAPTGDPLTAEPQDPSRPSARTPAGPSNRTPAPASVPAPRHAPGEGRGEVEGEPGEPGAATVPSQGAPAAPVPARPSVPPQPTEPPAPAARRMSDPHASILEAARAGRHSEAAAMAAAWEQEAMRAHGPSSSEAIHWLEVRADLFRLAGDSLRACELWMAAARIRLGNRQPPGHPDVEGAVDRAHHQWQEIRDPNRAAALAPLLIELRTQVPGRRPGALEAVRRRAELLRSPQAG